MGAGPVSAFPMANLSYSRFRMNMGSSSIPRQLRKWNSAPALLVITIMMWIFYRFGPVLQLRCWDSSPLAPSVNLVIAATQSQDTSWSSNININNLKIIPYVADNPNATYHPRQNKGREAMIILTYLHDFYDDLPDISIFTHADNIAWHNNVILNSSLIDTLNNLDLFEVQRRNYLSLSIAWENACPAWINMSVTFNSPQYTDVKREEPLMKSAFEQNFPNDTVPEIMSAPCCSQFAVTKSAIKRIPKPTYADFISHLGNIEVEDDLSGRIWEHWWQYLFLGKAVDCPVEYKALCAGFHICFEEQWEYEDYNVVLRLKGEREEERDKEQDIGGDKHKVHLLNWKIREIEKQKEGMMRKALENGRSELRRKEILGDYF